KSEKRVRQIDNDQQFFSLDVSPDGKYLALGGHQRLEIWDTATGNEVRAIQATDKDTNVYFRGVVFSPTGTMVAAITSGNSVQLWEVATGKERETYFLGVESPDGMVGRRRYYNPNEGVLTTLAFSVDGKLLAVGAVDNSIRIIDLLHGGELPPLVGHN